MRINVAAATISVANIPLYRKAGEAHLACAVFVVLQIRVCGFI